MLTPNMQLIVLLSLSILLLLLITIYIYLDSKRDAAKLVSGLLQEKLVAHASIDKDNASYSLIGGKIKLQTTYMITAQTKALLFTDIVEYTKSHGPENIRIYSLPITQCNEAFSEVIRTQTKDC